MLIKTKNDQKRKGLKIHLNASDDRGIDIIRNQINQFREYSKHCLVSGTEICYIR